MAEPTNDPLGAFVPRLALELGQLGVPAHHMVHGSMLSADISGFTALSERLAGKGKAGAEEITDLVNRCFTALIDAAYEFGGEVLKFGGDALLVLFRGDDHGRRSVDAGLGMQRALHASAAAKRASLTMTVGVAGGPFDVFLVGSGYRELLITGPRATEVIRLEGEAAKGDTLIEAALAELLPPDMIVRAESGGMVVTGSTGDAALGAVDRVGHDADLSPYVPRQVVEQLSAFEELGGEHRLVTVGFLMVTGVGELLVERRTRATAGALHDLVDFVVEACTTFGVTVLHTDIAPDGVKFVMCAGAPINAGDTGDAMLEAALRIATIDSPLVLRQGVQTGRVFAGFLGTRVRRTYTLMGDSVNTAARMLGKARDRDVVAVDTVVAGTRTAFVSEELEPFHVKGKTEPIVAHRVIARSDDTRLDTSGARLVGRRDELAVLSTALGSLDEVVVLSGPAGVGKSRLLDAAWDRAEGVAIYQAACSPYGATSPYSLFRPLLRTGAGIDLHADASQAGNSLVEVVERRTPKLLPMLPLLAVPFGAEVDPTPEADAIDPEFRRARIHDVLVEFLDTTLIGPSVLVAEDVHWIDDASGELLTHLVRASRGRPWSAVLTRRPQGTWTLPDDTEHVRTVDLEPLTDDDIRDLAIETADRSLSDDELHELTRRAGGNPLFAIELTRALSRDAGAPLPDTVERVISTRIDRLEPDQRRLIRVASVFGGDFDLAEVASVSGEPLAIGDQLADMVEHVGATNYRFRHAMYRDVAFEGLPFRQRRRLHGRVAACIKTRGLDEKALAPLLSLHYSAARLHRESWKYSVMAGADAEAQHATREAAAAYERAVDSARYCRDVDETDRSRIAELLGDQYYTIGQFQDATRAYRLARRLNPGPVGEIDLMRKLGLVFERQGEPQRAIRWFRRARRKTPDRAATASWAVARAEVALAEAGIRTRLGENEQCLALARSALADAELAGDERSTALALERIHVALVYLGDDDSGDTGSSALAAYRGLNDRNGEARVLINLGVEAYFESRWAEASERYLEATEIAQAAGNVVLAANAAINSAEILADQGDWSRAIDLFDDARRNYEAIGYVPGIAATLLFSAVATMRAGSLDESARRLDRAGSLLERQGLSELVDEHKSRRVELDLLTDSATLNDCLDLLAQLGPDNPVSSRVLRVQGLIEHRSGNRSASIATLRALQHAAHTTDFERALSSRALAMAADDPTESTSCDGFADEIFNRLAVFRPPPMVPGDLEPVESSAPEGDEDAPATTGR